MLSGLKHTFQSIDEHFHKIVEMIEAKFSTTERRVEEIEEKVYDSIRQDFLELRAEVWSFRSRIEALEVPKPDKMEVSTPEIIEVPIPVGMHKSESGRLVYDHEGPPVE